MNENTNKGHAEKQDATYNVGNAVVQVFAQVGTFNWCEPYKVETQTENRGSGFIINEDGYFITNAHVVSEAKRVWIHMPALGQQNIHAEIVGFCPERDLALLRIGTDDLDFVREHVGEIPCLSFGDSDTVRRTDMILVLGYPLGQFRLKSSTGVVSGRENGLGQALIQITAPINPGSSGGPLLNAHGQVIGITIAGVFDAQNVGYALPVNELKLILDDLYTQRLVRRPLLGARFIIANDEKAALLGNPLPSGLYISRIFSGSPLERAGVKAGDMLYEFNGFPIDAFGDTRAVWGTDKANFRDLIARVAVGETVQLVVYRTGQRHEITFTMEQMPLYPIRTKFPDYEPIDYEVIAGLVIMELADNHLKRLLPHAPELAKYTRMEHKTKSVLIIAHVLPGSQAQQLRMLQPGDIIQEVNGKKITTIKAFRQMTRAGDRTGFWQITTARDIVAVFSLDKILRDEQRLSRDFAYPISKVVAHLMRKRKRQ